MQGIYAIVNKKNGKMYIGSSDNAPNRLKQHERALRKGSHPNPVLQGAVDEEGIDTFEFKVIKEVEEADRLRPLEAEYIWEYKSAAWKNGYNQTEKATGRVADPPRLRKTFVVRLSQAKGDWIKKLETHRFEPFELILNEALVMYAKKYEFEEKYPQW